MDVHEAAVFVQAVRKLTGATRELVEQECKAPVLDDQAQQQSGDAGLLTA
jgi:hypothetical protein